MCFIIHATCKDMWIYPKVIFILFHLKCIMVTCGISDGPQTYQMSLVFKYRHYNVELRALRSYPCSKASRLNLLLNVLDNFCIYNLCKIAIRNFCNIAEKTLRVIHKVCDIWSKGLKKQLSKGLLMLNKLFG